MAKIVDKEEKKIRILEAALRVIGQKGIAGTKINDIAEEAGIGKGTIYLYFKNKEEILKSILKQHIGSSNHAIESIMEGAESPEEKVKALLADFISTTEHNHYPPSVQLEILAAVIRDCSNLHLSQGMLHFRSLLSQLLKDTDQSDAVSELHRNLASSIVALLHGLVILSSVDPENFQIKRIVTETTDFILKSLKKQ